MVARGVAPALRTPVTPLTRTPRLVTTAAPSAGNRCSWRIDSSRLTMAASPDCAAGRPALSVVMPTAPTRLSARDLAPIITCDCSLAPTQGDLNVPTGTRSLVSAARRFPEAGGGTSHD